MLVVSAFLLLCLSTTAQSFPSIEDCDLIDLTYPLNNKTIYWPGAQTFEHEVASVGGLIGFSDAKQLFMSVLLNVGDTSDGYYYSAYNFASAEHGGTHLDAPVHFARGKETTDQVCDISERTGYATMH